MNATAPTNCPQCGQTIAAGLQGLCSACLADLAFGAPIAAGNPAGQITLAATPVARRPNHRAAEPGFQQDDRIRYFGDYELIEEIARGGMGVVWKARQKTLNRLVALKMILSGQLATQAEVQRFHTEAEAAANLKHPNIVAIHEIGEYEGRHYFSMDLIEGQNLAQAIGGQPLLPGRAAMLVRTLAEAVHYAHQRGTLHRDLKPQNVLLDTQGCPHITDFGLAKQMASDSDLTKTGAVMGSPSYMPPEQALGRAVDIGPASDVYALGAILYQLLTGKAPFVGATAVDTLRMVTEQEPISPCHINLGVPTDLATICLKCLEKAPERRYHSARALAEELERFLNHEPILAKPASNVRKAWNWSQKNPWVFAATSGALVLVLICVAYGFWQKYRLAVWQLEFGKSSPLPAGESPAPMFFVYFLGICFLLYFAGNTFRKHYRQCLTKGTMLANRQLLFHGVLGVAGTAMAMGHLLAQIRAWVWLTSHPLVLGMELVGAMCALILGWLASRMVWEAMGIHESSRFQNIVNAALEREVAVEAYRWPLGRLVGLVVWLALVGGIGIALHQEAIERDNAFLVGSGCGLVLGFASGCQIARAIRRRQRLLYYCFIPAAMGAFVLTLAVLLLMEATLAFAALGVAGLFLGFMGWWVVVDGVVADKCGPVRFPGSPKLDALGGLTVLVSLFTVFQVVENWRGRREWQRVRTELEAMGESLNFDEFTKPPVPDEQNSMAHPFMKRHFLKGGESLPIAQPPVYAVFNYNLSDLKQLPVRSEDVHPILRLVKDQACQEVVPLLHFTNQPLSEVFAELSKRAGLKISFATNDMLLNTPAWVDSQKARQPPRVSASFTNITAAEAIDRLAGLWFLVPDIAKWQTKGELVLEWSKHPSLQGLRDWFAQYGSEFAQLEVALRRPYSRLKSDSHYAYFREGPNYVSFRTVAQAYASLCNLNLLLGDPDAAINDLVMLQRCVFATQANQPPTLVEAMIRSALAGMLARTLEETMAEGLWPSRYLDRIQSLVENMDLIAGYTLAVRGSERAGLLRSLEAMVEQGSRGMGIFRYFRAGDYIIHGKESSKLGSTLATLLIPLGWVEQNQARFATAHQLVLQSIDSKAQRLDVAAYEAAWETLTEELAHRHAYRLLAAIAIPNMVRAGSTLARNQTEVNLARVGIALERYRASMGAYPQQLALLAPQFLTEIPHDIFDGQPLRYRLIEPGKYVLYSVGWNTKDDGGTTGFGNNGQPLKYRDEIDWLWKGVPSKSGDARP